MKCNHVTRYLSDQELLPQQKHCMFCFDNGFQEIGLIQRNPDIFLFKCKNCHAVSASRLPNDEALTNYYSNYYVDNNQKLTIGNPVRLAKHIFNNLRFYIPNRNIIRILDFGGGSGEVSLEVAKQCLSSAKEVEIALVDYNSDLKEVDNKTIQIKHYYKLSEIKNHQFDIVIASAVIEHLPFPHDDLKLLFRSLNKDGLFYARTPYVVPFFEMFSKFNLKFDFTYPAHIHDLGPQFWENLFKWLPIQGKYLILNSKPSLVEASFRNRFFTAFTSYICKAPWYLLGNRYNFVGGWEVFVKKVS